MAPLTRSAAPAPTSAEAPSTSGQADSKVLYVGHLPHGFYEDELRGFFTQFGQVTRLRVSRNRRTGKSKNYAYLEFKAADVAAIAAEAMDGYFLFKQKLVCNLVPAADQHPELWKGANKSFAKIPWQRIERERHNKPKTAAEQEKHQQRALRRDEKRKQRIQAAGIEYDFEPLEKQLPKRARHMKYDD
ncbi:hypothetical protein WJX73_004322 [Symbiochloris irregularis]|uniref:RRM domain-containing protein n=1 Tax=Symbiochloris irregularis TaxID=706552 RepID=A0AAW1NKW0_9CHLO